MLSQSIIIFFMQTILFHFPVLCIAWLKENCTCFASGVEQKLLFEIAVALRIIFRNCYLKVLSFYGIPLEVKLLIIIVIM